MPTGSFFKIFIVKDKEKGKEILKQLDTKVDYKNIRNFINNQKNIESEYLKVLKDNFWELLL